jgi:hypothetical protein
MAMLLRRHAPKLAKSSLPHRDSDIHKIMAAILEAAVRDCANDQGYSSA